MRVGLGVSTQDTVTLNTAVNGSSTNNTRVAFNRAAHGPVRMQVQRTVRVDSDTVDSGMEDSESTGKPLSLCATTVSAKCDEQLDFSFVTYTCEYLRVYIRCMYSMNIVALHMNMSQKDRKSDNIQL